MFSFKQLLIVLLILSLASAEKAELEGKEMQKAGDANLQASSVKQRVRGLGGLGGLSGLSGISGLGEIRAASPGKTKSPTSKTKSPKTKSPKTKTPKTKTPKTKSPSPKTTITITSIDGRFGRKLRQEDVMRKEK